MEGLYAGRSISSKEVRGDASNTEVKELALNRHVLNSSTDMGKHERIGGSEDIHS